MEKFGKMKSGLLIAAVLGGMLSTNSALALDGNVFPGKGSKAAWSQACKFLDEGVAIAKRDETAALLKFEKAIAIYPYADCFYRNLGLSLEKQKKPDLKRSESVYRKATELDPKDWRNWNGLANVIGDQQRYSECRDALKRAMNCNPPSREGSEINKQIKNLDNYLQKQ